MQQLSEEERERLEELYSEGYKFVARDGYGSNVLYSYSNKPKKGPFDWYDELDDDYKRLSDDDDSEEFLDFITWMDDEPYEIEKLLEGDNNENT